MALNEKKFHDASLRPPSHVPSAADVHRAASCLLDLTAYISDRTNGTTATCEAKGGRKFQVTFFYVHPPGVSFLCVYCPGLPPTEFACEPTVVATEADLVLIRVAFGPYDNAFSIEKNDLFIYKAAGAGKVPSLRHIPHPKPFVFFADYQLGLLPRYEEEADLYYIAALHTDDGSRRRRRRRSRKEAGPFQIHLFSSKTGYWIAKPTSLDQRWRHGELNSHFQSTKVITIGGEGGAVAWVDLWQGLLQCNVLDRIPKLHYVPLPPPLLPDKMLSGSPWLSRDIAMVKVHIKYVELQIRICQGTDSDGQYISDGWTAVAWSRTAANTWDEDGWQKDSEVDSDHVSADPLLLDQLPKLQDSRGRPEPTLQRLRTGHPTLSLHDDSVIYLMTKIADWEDDAWVLAIDMTKRKLQQVATFGAERTLGISFSYVHSRISNSLSMDQDSRQRDGSVMYKQLGTASASADEHSNNLPTAQAYADKATDANTGGPVTEIHRPVWLSSIDFARSYTVMAFFIISVAVAGFVMNTAAPDTADRAMVLSNFVLLLCGLALLIAASSERRCTLLDRFVSGSYGSSVHTREYNRRILDNPMNNNN